MKHKYILPSLLLLILGCNLFAQSVSSRGRATNSVYFYEDTTKHMRLYQVLRFHAFRKDHHNLSFNLNARALTDVNEEIENVRRFNAYRLSISAKGMFNNFLDFEIGRQFLHPGTPLGSFDGVNILIRPMSNLKWQIYGGAETHFYRSLKIYELDKATVYGTSIVYHNFYQTDFQALYLQKLHSGNNQWQITGLNIVNKTLKTFKFTLQSHYDLVNSRFHRMYFSTRFRPNEKLSMTLNLKQQYPQIYGTSFFKTFKVREYRQAVLSTAYAISEKYAVSGSIYIFELSENQGQRILISMNDNNGSLGFIYELGDLGNQIGVLFDYGYEVVPDLITSISMDYSRYRFEEVFEFENQLANALRVTYKLSRHWKTDLEYQWLKHLDKNSDSRILSHIYFIW